MDRIIAFREEYFRQINEFLKNRALILLWGKSGTGKSILLQRLAYYHKEDFVNKIFTDEGDFDNFIRQKKRKVIILDEVGMYSVKVLECIRIYSDQMSFVLSSHKKNDLFQREYFKSRFSAIFCLKSPTIDELSAYIRMKFHQDLSKKSLKFLIRVSQGNLRYIDRIVKNFCELKNYGKTQEYILKLSALEQGFLK